MGWGRSPRLAGKGDLNNFPQEPCWLPNQWDPTRRRRRFEQLPLGRRAARSPRGPRARRSCHREPDARLARRGAGSARVGRPGNPSCLQIAIATPDPISLWLRDSGALAGGTAPLRVVGALLERLGTVLAQMPLQRAALQDGRGSSSGSRSGSAVSSGSGLCMSRNASINVLACLRAGAPLADRAGDLLDLGHGPTLSTV